MRSWPNLDGLRAVAALLVLVSHVGFWTGQTAHGYSGALIARGDSGVAVFFAISAFLLAGPWIAPDPTHPPRVKQYAVRRAARLLPGYFLALAAVLAAAAYGAGDGLGSPQRIAAHAVLAQGLTGHTYQGFSQTWSLTTEASFYILLPLLAALGLGLSRRRAARGLLALGLLLICIGLPAHLALAQQQPGVAVAATSVLGHAAWFGAGILALGLRWRAPASGGLRASIAGVRAPVLLLIAVATYAVAATGVAGPVGLSPAEPSAILIKEALYTLLALVLVLAATAPRDRAGRAVLGSTPLRALGRISYGVFLWHVLVIQLLYLLTGRPLFSGAFLIVLVATLAFTLIAAMASWVLVERPALEAVHRAAHAPRRRRRATAR